MIRSAALVTLAAVVALAVGCSKKADDKAKLQGEWTITEVELPDMPANEKRGLEQFKELNVNVSGDRVTIRHPNERGRVAVYFTISATKTPKEIDSTEATVSLDDKEDRDEHLEVRGIYKFEGDELVLALPLGKGKDLPRPTEFKPSANAEKGHAVLVFHLKKKK